MGTWGSPLWIIWLPENTAVTRIRTGVAAATTQSTNHYTITASYDELTYYCVQEHGVFDSTTLVRRRHHVSGENICSASLPASEMIKDKKDYRFSFKTLLISHHILQNLADVKTSAHLNF